MRKIIQIAVSEAMAYDKNCNDLQQSETIFALCNDGTLWRRWLNAVGSLSNEPKWVKIENVPQDDFLGIKTDQFSALKYINTNELEISVRSYIALIHAGIYDLYKLTQTSENRLKSIKNLGRVSSLEVIDKLFDYLISNYSIDEIKSMPVFNSSIGSFVIKNKEKE